ncbi:DUF1353 domain-containing protein [Candidatus Albibeggiatoa sp. nov. BB20]|uniref:DUF1353 domain-containing protein n=1 Tax=Candidatus Albibeggiatoa sp. nov. BB20 TaxID=3162723 RepID=UPI00336577D5
MRFLLIIMMSILLANCTSIDVNKVQTGRFEGKLNLEWRAPNCFLYTPDPEDPLIFYRANGQKIIPKTMYTDGGSIPRFLWNTPNLSPWDFAPAYLIHDWLFEQQHCFPQQRFVFQDTAVILAEAVKTMIEADCVEADDSFVGLIYDSVNSSVAQKLWDNGQCYLPQQHQVSVHDSKTITFNAAKLYDENNQCPFEMPDDHCPW